jgi:D-alanine transaminase
MSRIAYVNGRYLPRRAAMVNVEDRGYQFADGVYEVCEVRGGAIIDQSRHLARLQRSLGELRIRMPVTLSALAVILRETVHRNRVRDGLVYLQVTRGVARRDFSFPPPDTQPSLVVSARSLDFAGNERRAARGIAVITTPESRWARVDIKSVSLLPNVLAKQTARDRGADEAWFVDRDGRVTEGASSNAWIVTQDRRVITRPADNGILRGITRTVLIELLEGQDLRLEERPFKVEEAYGAAEAFVTAASQIVMPVVRIDDRPIGNGSPGPVARLLRENFHHHAEWS